MDTTLQTNYPQRRDLTRKYITSVAAPDDTKQIKQDAAHKSAYLFILINECFKTKGSFTETLERKPDFTADANRKFQRYKTL